MSWQNRGSGFNAATDSRFILKSKSEKHPKLFVQLNPLPAPPWSPLWVGFFFFPDTSKHFSSSLSQVFASNPSFSKLQSTSKSKVEILSYPSAWESCQKMLLLRTRLYISLLTWISPSFPRQQGGRNCDLGPFIWLHVPARQSHPNWKQYLPFLAGLWWTCTHTMCVFQGRFFFFFTIFSSLDERQHAMLSITIIFSVNFTRKNGTSLKRVKYFNLLWNSFARIPETSSLHRCRAGLCWFGGGGNISKNLFLSLSQIGSSLKDAAHLLEISNCTWLNYLNLLSTLGQSHNRHNTFHRWNKVCAWAVATPRWDTLCVPCSAHADSNAHIMTKLRLFLPSPG